LTQAIAVKRSGSTSSERSGGKGGRAEKDRGKGIVSGEESPFQQARISESFISSLGGNLRGWIVVGRPLHTRKERKKSTREIKSYVGDNCEGSKTGFSLDGRGKADGRKDNPANATHRLGGLSLVNEKEKVGGGKDAGVLSDRVLDQDNLRCRNRDGEEEST